MEDLESTKMFRPIDGQYEGKLFAETLKDAGIFGRNFFKFDLKAFFVVEVEVPDDFRFGYEYPDQALGVGATLAVDREQLDSFNQNVSFTILQHVDVG